MSVTEKHLAVALTLSTFVILLNIIAVTQSTEANYLSQLGQLFSSILPG